MQTAVDSPSCCGCKVPPDCGPTKGPCSGAYHVMDWLDTDRSRVPTMNPRYPITELANSILIEWHNNNNNFFRQMPPKTKGELPYCDGWLTNLDAAQDLTLANLSGPGHWNDYDMLTVGCNNATGVIPGNTPCAGHQSLMEQKAQ